MKLVSSTDSDYFTKGKTYQLLSCTHKEFTHATFDDNGNAHFLSSEFLRENFVVIIPGFHTGNAFTDKPKEVNS